MKRITKIITFDGELFDSEKEAEKHLDKIYGDLLLMLSRNLCVMNYTQVTDNIDGNLDKFIRLDRIKNDMILEDDE